MAKFSFQEKRDVSDNPEFCPYYWFGIHAIKRLKPEFEKLFTLKKKGPVSA